MEIIFDTRWFGAHGIGRFAYEVYSRCGIFSALPNLGKPTSPLDPIRLYRHLALAKGARFISPGYNAPVGRPIEFMFTIHDLCHIDMPQDMAYAKKLYYAAVVKPAVSNALRVFTDSEFSRTRILEWSGAPDDKVITVGCAPSSTFCPSGPKHLRSKPYVFCCSNRKPHKNEFRLVDAFKITKTHREATLVFSGFPTPELLRHIHNLELASQVEFTGLLGEEDLASWYRGAVLTAFVSLYEGFGLPVIESMACGTPVVASNSTSLPEVAGDAAILVEATSTEDIAQGIDSIFFDQAIRDDLRKRGSENASRFSWAKVAERVLEASAENI
jgi:glycosyltransferase involved in cell wall biosynthesis